MHQRIQKWLQLVTFGLLMLFVGAQFDHQAKTVQPVGIADSDWSVDKAADMDRYLTAGQQVSGHYFGALNIKGQCQRDIMLLSLSSSDTRIHNYEGEQVLLKVSIGERSELIRLPILGMVDSGFGSQMVLMSNFEMNDAMRNDMLDAQHISIEVLQPEAMAELLTVAKESFSLRGFDTARIQSQHNCRLI